jgi:Holliday junction resolvasome RuvABC endonuclease subunit
MLDQARDTLPPCPSGEIAVNLPTDPASRVITVAGIDPGIRGGLAAVRVAAADGCVGTLLSAIDIPTVGDGARERVDVAAVRDWLNTFKPAFVLVERAQAMPRQGASSGFKYGRATGSIEAAVVLSAIPLEIVEPAAWKRYWHLPGKDKERARQKALEVFPAAHDLLARKKDHGRGEAGLLALYGIRTSQLMPVPSGADAPAAPQEIRP